MLADSNFLAAPQIPDGLITNSKLADMAQATLKGRAAGAGTGVPQDLTAVQVRAIVNVEDGSTADQTAGEIEAIVSHNNLLDVLAAEHVDWAGAGAGTIHPDNYIEGGAGTDTTAIHDDTAGEIAAIAAKSSPIGDDVILIEDSEDADNKKSVALSVFAPSTSVCSPRRSMKVGSISRWAVS